MTLSEKKQIYLDRFPSIIARRMVDQFDEVFFDGTITLGGNKKTYNDFALARLLLHFAKWEKTNEKHQFWSIVFELYHNETIEHQQILDIFHKHGIKP